jgi:hypothetical protein
MTMNNKAPLTDEEMLVKLEFDNAQLCRELEAAKSDRDCFRAFIEGRGHRNIDDFAKRGVEYSHEQGQLFEWNEGEKNKKIEALQSKLSKAEEERDRMREAAENGAICLEAIGFVYQSGEAKKDAKTIRDQIAAASALQPIPQTEGREVWQPIEKKDT